MRAHPWKTASALIVSAAISWLSAGADAQDRTSDQAAPAQTQKTSPPSDETRTEETRSAGSYYAVQSYQLVGALQPTKGVAAQYGRVETRAWPNRRLMGTSALVFTAAYVPTIISAAVNDDDSSDNLYIPIAGPWMEIARDPVSPGNKALLALSGVFQDLGALGLVTSMVVPQRETKRWRLMSSRRLSAAPVADRYTYGLSARGQF